MIFPRILPFIEGMFHCHIWKNGGYIICATLPGDGHQPFCCVLTMAHIYYGDGDIVKDPVVTNEVCCPPFCAAILLLRSTSPKKPSISFKDFKKHIFEDIVFLWQNVASPFRQSLMATSLQNSFTWDLSVEPSLINSNMLLDIYLSDSARQAACCIARTKVCVFLVAGCGSICMYIYMYVLYCILIQIPVLIHICILCIQYNVHPSCNSHISRFLYNTCILTLLTIYLFGGLEHEFLIVPIILGMSSSLTFSP